MSEHNDKGNGKMATQVEEARGVVTKISRAKELGLTRQPRLSETIIQILLFLCGIVSIFTTLGIVFVLGEESLRFFQEVSVSEFLGGTTWTPRVREFGVLPLITATVVTSVLAMVVSLPLGLASAIYLSEYASERVRKTLKPLLEILAGIPTVVYGYFALTFMTPLLGIFFGDSLRTFNMLSAGIVMGIMILPMVASMSEDALSAVPLSLREAAYGLGSTKFETSVKIVVPAAFSGIIAAFIIAVSRAIGETMIVAIAAGNGPRFTFNPLKDAQTMTGYIAAISQGETSFGSTDYNSIFAIGLTLFAITLILNILSRFLVERFREEYE